ncbi:MAG: DUF4105 domain-containing protein [Muribaculaceae bacterium]|nr:DUF4105 domain-containing protein [Muribaculaceae bacterium]
MLKTKIRIITLLILSLLPAFAQRERQDSVIVSLITCAPGAEVYELCGHEAVRVRGIGPEGFPVDSVWNYGTFDFQQPNFIYRFVKGETDYMLSSYPFAWFIPEYQAAGRRVVEQDLNLNRDEALRMLTMLREEARPENRVYRYNYVKDNCATRITTRLDEVLGAPATYPDSLRYGTFRNEMRAYHKDYPWYQFGIDLCLGSGIDYPVTSREEMFVPLEMERTTACALRPDGRPLVSATRTLNAGVADATLGPTPWYLTPLAAGWAFFALTCLFCALMWRKHTIWRWFFSLWYTILGLLGCLLTFLIFVSTHEATAPNLLYLWLNPLQLVIGAGVWIGRWRPAVTAMAICNSLLLTVLLIGWAWQGQSANPAFFPLMGATLISSATYAIITRKIS